MVEFVTLPVNQTQIYMLTHYSTHTHVTSSVQLYVCHFFYLNVVKLYFMGPIISYNFLDRK